MTYDINKGIGQVVEFQGLKTPYLFYLAGDLPDILLAFTLLYLGGVQPVVCVGFDLVASSVFLHLVFRWNRVYGPTAG